ncbi:hypothetical protein TNCV_4559751 [Trichonephila clavipes]|nr:hypothetical protein TNCV_4559751 [Trichonephila clavipes]
MLLAAACYSHIVEGHIRTRGDLLSYALTPPNNDTLPRGGPAPFDPQTGTGLRVADHWLRALKEKAWMERVLHNNRDVLRLLEAQGPDKSFMMP